MLGVGLGMAIAVGGFVLLVRRWRRGEAPGEFVIGTLPFALTLVSIPLSVAAWQIGDVFRELAESPAMGPDDAAARFAALGRDVWTAVLACVALLTGAAALQIVAARRGQPPSAVQPARSDTRSLNWRGWFPVLSVIWLAPVVALGRMVREIPPLILGPMSGPVVGDRVAADAMVALGALGDASLLIDSRVQAAVVVGAITTTALMAAGVGTLRALEYRRVRNERLAWLAFGVVAMLLAWGAVALTAGRTVEALSK